MALDPEIAAVLETLKGAKSMDLMTLEELRASMVPLPMERRTAVAAVEDITIQDGLRARTYAPSVRLSDALVVFFHGGGFVLGNLETHDHVCRDVCASAGCIVMAIDYRLAPEHPFPAASDDCLAAARWAKQSAASLGASVDRILLMGDSAGGTLAFVTAMRLRDEGGGPVAGMALCYPVTDYHTPATASYLENASGYSLTRSAMIRFWRDYLADQADAQNPHASPLRAPDFSNLPPALVITAQYDPLRDEGDALAERLLKSGVAVTHLRYDGLIHGFLRMGAVSRRARESFQEIGQWIRGQVPSAQGRRNAISEGGKT